MLSSSSGLTEENLRLSTRIATCRVNSCDITGFETVEDVRDGFNGRETTLAYGCRPKDEIGACHSSDELLSIRNERIRRIKMLSSN